MNSSHEEVLIIGAGPTGLFLAGELARHGVRARIIDRSPSPHTQTRATGVQPAVLEVLARSGIVAPFIAEGERVKSLRVFDAGMREAFVLDRPHRDSPYPFTCSIPQWRTEEILAGRVEEFGIPIERGVTATEISSSPDGAVVECQGPHGRTFRIEADYLVGAGGAHGPVRGALHERLEGITYPLRYLVADVRADLPRGDELLGVAISPAGMLMIAELPGGRNLLVMDMPDDWLPAESLGMPDVAAGLAMHLTSPFAISDLRWVSQYRTHRRMAPSFSQGRCFLAGDAAHLSSPLGGEGMNAGILDGVSLAWKLSSVLRRSGTPLLLEAYSVERQDIARQILASSEATADFYYQLVAQARRGHPLAPPPQDPTRRVTSPLMLDLNISESPIIGFHGFTGIRGSLKPGDRFPERTKLTGELHHLLVYGDLPDPGSNGFAARWRDVLVAMDGNKICPAERCGLPGTGAVLIRPDGYVGFQATSWDAASCTALESFLGQQFIPRLT